MRLLPTILLAFPVAALAQAPCVDGSAGDFACQDVDLLAHLSKEELGDADADGHDIWGWTDPETGKEYALMGLSSRTVFVDVSMPTNPMVIGWLPTETVNSNWRDIKTIGNYAYIGSEAEDHGIQIFDLTRLRDVSTPPEEFDTDAHYAGIGQSHNIVAFEEAELVIPVGSVQGSMSCSAGLAMVDVSDPMNPTHLGCYEDGQNAYVHDAQCVVYNGPDSEHAGKDICFTSSEDFAAIVDVTDPSNPELINRLFYPNFAYTHQGWLTEDQAWFVVNDELDSGTTSTMFFDVSDLETADLAYTRPGPTQATDHNLYIRDGFMHQTNYTIGYRLWDIHTPEDENSVNEIAWFDTYPENDNHGFEGGTWSNYPFFESGVVIASSIDRGLFVLQPYEASVALPTFGAMEFSSPEAGAGDVVTLSMSVLNRDRGGAASIALSNTLPEDFSFQGNIVASSGEASEAGGVITWNVDVETDSTETISFDVLVNEDASPGIHENTATITAPTGDPVPLSALILVDVEPDLTVTAASEVAIPNGGYPGDCAASELIVTEPVSFETVGLGITAEHSWRGDLVITLESPDGTSATLIDRVGSGDQGTGAHNLDALVLAGGPPDAFGHTTHDLSSPFYEVRGAPEQGPGGVETLGSLDSFAGTGAQGTWTLTVCDAFAADDGTLLQWSLLFYGATVADEATPEALADVLSAPSPNPAQGSTTFTLAVENGQNVSVDVFDATGRRLQTLYDGALPAGMSETLTLDTSTLPAGVYVIRATGDDFVKTRRITVVR